MLVVCCVLSALCCGMFVDVCCIVCFVHCLFLTVRRSVGVARRLSRSACCLLLNVCGSLSFGCCLVCNVCCV